MMRRALTLLLLAGCAQAGPATAAPPPNIVYILADDLGSGDLSCLNPDSKIRTPHLDGLAAQGMIFRDAHSGSSVCTPTRYGILTGRYAWRTRLQQGVLDGFSPPLIDPKRLTVASLLKGRGYRTSCVGKWHLGMDWPSSGGAVDYTKPIRNGPTAVGFDEYYGISASLDMPPYVWIENDRTVGIPTATKTWIRSGPAHPDFEAIDVLPTVARKAVEFLDRRPAPFFLYVPLNGPHTPILPAPEFEGKSGLGKYGDFVLQVDATVGEILKALDRNGLAENTLVVVTSDNGFSPAADHAGLRKQGHHPSHIYRGYKADVFEGGHRVPFIVRWPGKVRAGSSSDRTICLTDLMATCAEILGVPLPAGAGEDSVSFLPALLGKPGPGRDSIVHHSINGSFAIRRGSWKMAFCPDSGGWSEPRPGKAKDLPDLQLYDLALDPGERKNLQAEHPEALERMTRLLQEIVDSKPNDVPVAIRKRR